MLRGEVLHTRRERGEGAVGARHRDRRHPVEHIAHVGQPEVVGVVEEGHPRGVPHGPEHQGALHRHGGAEDHGTREGAEARLPRPGGGEGARRLGGVVVGLDAQVLHATPCHELPP